MPLPKRAIARSTSVIVQCPSEKSDVFWSSMDDLTNTLIFKHYIDIGNTKPIKQRVYRASHHHHKEIERRARNIFQNGIEPLVLGPVLKFW